MQQKTLIALGAMVVIAVLAFFTMRAPEKGAKVGPRERPIAALKADDVKEIEVTSGKDHVVLKKAESGWRMVVPGDYAVDQQSVKSALEQLEKVQFGDLVTEKKEKFSDFEVSDDKGAHVIAKGMGKTLFDAVVGKSVSGFTMVRPSGKDGGKDQVWQTTGIFKYTYAKDSKAWRDHNVFDFKTDEASKLSVEAFGQKVALEKIAPPADAKDKPPASETHWKVLEASVKVDPLDDAVANQMVQTLSTLRAADFDDAAKPAEVGITTPRYRISVTVKGQPMTLLIGNAKGDDVWLAVDGKPQVYLFRKTMMDRITQKPIDFRDKTLVKAKAEDITEIDLTHGSESVSLTKDKAEWKVTKGKLDLDESKAKPLDSAFEDLKGASFAEVTDAATTGLGKPAGSVTLHLRDKSTVALKIGNESADKSEYYVQKAGVADVVMVKKYLIDRFFKKPSELAKAAK